MKHIANVSKLPVVATTDIGSLIGGVGKATGWIIFASSAAAGVKTLVGNIGS